MSEATKHIQHTPGPWRVERTNNPGTCIVAEDTPGYFAVMRSCSTHHIQSLDSNSRLIVAACNSYDKHCGPRAIEAAEADLLGKALEALREIDDAVPSGDPLRMSEFAASLQNIATNVLALVDGGAA